jgi:molecular chaperone DnaK (HSP70)
LKHYKIVKNTGFPAAVEVSFVTTEEKQNTITIRLSERIGNEEKEINRLGKYVIQNNLTGHLSHQEMFEVRFEVDSGGQLNVSLNSDREKAGLSINQSQAWAKEKLEVKYIQTA